MTQHHLCYRQVYHDDERIEETRVHFLNQPESIISNCSLLVKWQTRLIFYSLKEHNFVVSVQTRSCKDFCLLELEANLFFDASEGLAEYALR